jgi:hypothetical protein
MGESMRRFELVQDGDVIGEGVAWSEGPAVLLTTGAPVPTTFERAAHVLLAHPRGELRWIDAE